MEGPFFHAELYAFPDFFSDARVYSSQEIHNAAAAPTHNTGLASEKPLWDSPPSTVKIAMTDSGTPTIKAGKMII